MRGLKNLSKSDRITYKEIGDCYKSWRGNLEDFDCYWSLISTDLYFEKLFGHTYSEFADLPIIHFFPEGIKLDRAYFYNKFKPLYRSNELL